MTKDFNFTTEYILNKTFFAECYDQTSLPTKFPKAYLKSVLLFIFGVVLLKFELAPSSYVGWFFIALGVIEALSVYFKRTWWLWRQNLSMGSGSTVTFKVSNTGVSYDSGKNKRDITWCEIDKLEQSDLGFILHMGKQRQYVSKSCLNDEVITFMTEQHAASKSDEH
ncbi:DUF308 domain-containing protein [Vibrio sp. SS-MA-C1-2]|uniref:DUF308 domain-containing protein n=1 Tax=Vibrio sp. SS-MA-C1-2 TaxID=2908646 RepID=UPI001F40450A|nr:DUF308 domain-containing protein [Vibrio sp. SS-MA-C1-2]UJF17023.1 DUF308 domain-containing protein [Vibrio sp. SS-MA-C1-2]